MPSVLFGMARGNTLELNAEAQPPDRQFAQPVERVRRRDASIPLCIALTTSAFHDWTVVITTCGRIGYHRRKINVSQVFAGQKVGVKQLGDHFWLVTFMEHDLRYFDDETCRLEPLDNPFGPKLLPMSPE